MMRKLSLSFLAAVLSLSTLGCNSNPPVAAPLCQMPQGNDLNAAAEQARFDLRSGCAARFDDYFQTLLSIGAGNPDAQNRRQLSAFLEWSVEQGLLSKRQAQDRYNRYFNVKYVSLKSDYSVCSETCPNRGKILADMRSERKHKELGLLKISGERSAYQRADRLYHETELVLEATCNACGSL
jgi:hypothetical protein